MRIRVLLLALIPLLFCGCWDQKVFEENTIVLSAGVDRGKEDFNYTFVSEGGTGDEKKLNLTTINSKILSEAIVKANRESGSPLQAGKLQTILFSEAVAKRGFSDLIDNHKMEEVNRFLPDYIVTECAPQKIYKTINDMKLGDQTFTYLDSLLKSAADSGHCPNIFDRDYDIDFLNDNPDPVLPLLTVEGEKPAITGTAVFKEKKMVGKLPAKESSFLHLVAKKDTQFAFTPAMPGTEGKEPLIFQTNRCNSTLKVTIENGSAHIYITEDINGFFDKLIWVKLVEKYGYDAMETYLTHFFERQTLHSMVTLQALGSDPLGVKGKIQAFHPEFAASHDMDKAYGNAIVTVKAKINIKNSAIP